MCRRHEQAGALAGVAAEGACEAPCRAPFPLDGRTESEIRGTTVCLRPSRESDKRAIYSWLAQSDITASMMGPPRFPDVEPPTWEEFCADYGPSFFAGAQPEVEASYVIEVEGEALGQINYEIRNLPSRHAELDIWLRSQADTGHGYGPDALVTLMRHLSETQEVHRFLIRPSARNTRAVRAYEKAGFRIVHMTAARQAELYGAGDYEDSVVLVRDDCG